MTPGAAVPRKEDPMADLVAGLDLGSSTCHLVALAATAPADPGLPERPLFDRRFATRPERFTAIVRELRLQGEPAVHVESGELAAWAVGLLEAEQIRVVVGDPRRNRWIARDPAKNDRLDATKLAQLLRAGLVRSVYVERVAERAAFRALVRHFDQLTAQKVRVINQLRGRLRAHGYFGTRVGLEGDRTRGTVLLHVPAGPPRFAVEALYDLHDHVVTALVKTARRLAEAAAAFPEIAWLRSMPGMGLITAARFVAYVQTPARFRTKRQLWRYARLAVVQPQSNGRPIGAARLERHGHGRLKALSHQVFYNALRCKVRNVVHRTYEATLARGGHPDHARLTTQRKILTVLWTMWKRGEGYRDLGEEGAPQP
jgi:transposase